MFPCVGNFTIYTSSILYYFRVDSLVKWGTAPFDVKRMAYVNMLSLNAKYENITINLAIYSIKTFYD